MAILCDTLDRVILKSIASFEARTGVRPVVVIGRETYKEIKADSFMYVAEVVDEPIQAKEPTLFGYGVVIGFFDYGFTVTYPEQKIY